MKRNLFAAKKQNIFSDDSGSVLVMVLIAFMFVSVLVAIIMSSTVVNFRMRAMDRNVKDEFYYVEKALDDIYTGIGLDASQNMGQVYNTVLSGKGVLHGYAAETELDSIRMFNKAFVEKMEADYTAVGFDLKNYVVGAEGRNTNVEWDKVFTYRYEDTGKYLEETVSKNGLPKIKDLSGNPTSETDYGRVRELVFKDVKVSSTRNDYESVITTDIAVKMPSIDFIIVNAKALDYAIVANDGIYFEGSPTETTTVNGNLYGGGLTDDKIDDALSKKAIGEKKALSSKEMGGINVTGTNVNLESAYIISGADINIEDSQTGEHGKLTIDNKFDATTSAECEVWFENLNINTNYIPPASNPNERYLALDVNGSFYALDDLVMNGNNSRAKFRGEYFGYNSESVSDDDSSKMVVKAKDFVTDLSDGNTVKAVEKSSASSSIVMNGKNSEIDMKDLHTFVMLGKAYINHSTLENDTVYVSNLDTADLKDKKDIATAESVATKVDQELYLVPTEFLQSSNPVATDAVGVFNDDNVKIPDEWFGTDYLATPRYKTVYVKIGSTTWAYCYLNFKDGGQDGTYIDYRTQYIAEIVPHVINKSSKTRTEDANKYFILDPEQVVGPTESEKGEKLFDYIPKRDLTKVDYKIKPTPTQLYERLLTISESQGSAIYIGKNGLVDSSGQGKLANNAADDISTHVYSPNGIVQNSIYEETAGSNIAHDGQNVVMKMNEVSIERFLNYRTNMYNKYRWIDTYLDTQETHALTTLTAGTQNHNWEATATPDADYIDDDLPVSRLVWVNGGIASVDFAADSSTEDLPGTVVVSNENLTFDSTNTQVADYIVDHNFDGFILVDGDVTIGNGVNVNGYIYATGKVILKGNNKITFDTNLVQRRLEKEVDIVKSRIKRDGVNAFAYEKYFLSKYLLNIKPNGGVSIQNITNNIGSNKRYIKYYYDKVDEEAQTVLDYDIDYRDFVVYENWRKGAN